MTRLPNYPIHSSIVASSISMTGMSSLIGYNRLQVPHLSAVPFLTSVTGVLQLGQARISSSSWSTGMPRIYDTFRLLWNNSRMKFAALLAAFSVSLPFAADARAAVQGSPRGQRPAPATATAPPEKVADAYAQFLLGHRFEENEDESSAIAAYKRAMELDPNAAEIPAQLAGLYLKQSKVQEAMAAAETALKIAPANREANRVLGTVYAALSESGQPVARGRGADQADTNLAKAIRHFEMAL